MYWLYLHLATNHFPIVPTIIGTVACLIGAAKRMDGAWRFGMICLAIGGFAVIPSWITGYQAHYVVEYRLGLPEGIVEPHELLAEGLLWIMLPLAGISTFAWWRAREEPRRGPSPAWVRPLVLIMGIAGTGMVSVTAYAGGKIAHGASPNAPAAGDSAAVTQQSPARPPSPGSGGPGTRTPPPQ